MSVSIIIVNYNVAKEIDDCIESIFKFLDVAHFEIIVLDNNSTDRKIDEVSKKYPLVKFIFLTENLGYARANNLGAELSKYDNILLLNPDTILIEDFITPFLQYTGMHNNIGACGPMLLYKDKSYQNSSGPKLGLLYETAEAFMLINLYRKLLKFLNGKNYNIKKPFRVSWLSGACLFIRKEIFNAAGGFNPDYFLNYEDIDLCKKIDDKGFINLYFPDYKCIHIDQSSQKKNFEKLVLSRYQSRIIYSNIHYGWFERNLIKSLHIVGLISRLVLVNFLYTNDEKKFRKSGYKKALKLYLKTSKLGN